MGTLKKIARRFVFPTIVKLGIEKHIRNSSSNCMLNLMYHGVVPVNANSFSPRHITTEQFEMHLKYFLKNFDILSLSEAFDQYWNEYKPKRKTITISFDDGYRNNLIYALPILKKYGVKATFFVSGICTQDMKLRILWFDILACLKYFNKNEIVEVDKYSFRNFIDTKNKTTLFEYLKSLQPGHQEDIVSFLVEKYGIYDKLKQLPTSIWELMNKEDIQKLSSVNDVVIGSHGHSHYDLDIISSLDASIEMKKSKTLLENLINKEVDIISFPFGNYNNETKNIAELIGYNKQIAVRYQSKEDINDKRILNRHGISSTTTFESNIFFINKAFIKSGYN